MFQPAGRYSATTKCNKTEISPHVGACKSTPTKQGQESLTRKLLYCDGKTRTFTGTKIEAVATVSFILLFVILI